MISFSIPVLHPIRSPLTSTDRIYDEIKSMNAFLDIEALAVELDEEGWIYVSGSAKSVMDIYLLGKTMARFEQRLRSK